jgi:hypothetical protein
MNPNPNKTRVVNRRANERGAALITALLVSTLLLIVGGALILTTSVAQGLAIDATSEIQAYYSAEAGVNAVLNTLRGNVASNPAGTNANFRNVADNPDMSTWLAYDTTINGVNVVQVDDAPTMGFTISVTDPDSIPAPKQPNRLIIHSTGYGPKGSKKQMEVVVSRYIFDFFAPSTILTIGNDDGSAMTNFAIGDSNAKEYSGYDQSDLTTSIPVFGTTHANDLTQATSVVGASKPTTVSAVEKVTELANNQLPYWLQSADAARSFLNTMRERAQTTGRYFSGNTADQGTQAEPKYTFIDGDATLTEGAGLLIVTGKLVSDGNTGFKGVILCLGGGEFERSGTGNSDLLGAIVVAKFDQVVNDNNPHPFLTPIFNVSGGGTGLTAYSTDWIDKALAANGVRTLGVREY